jgi:hypothetical protein
MERIFLILISVIGMFAFCGCEKENSRRPGNQAVEDAFTAKYADVTGASWEKKGDYRVVDFRKDTKNMEAWFGNNSEWYFTETDIRFDALPEAPKTALRF